MALGSVLLLEGGYLVIHLAHLFLADIQTRLKLGLHCIEDSFEAGRVVDLDLVNIADNAVMTFVYFSEALALAAFANHLCFYTFLCHMDQMCFETLQHFAAVIDARRLLNIACPSVSESIVVRVNYLAVISFASSLNLSKNVFPILIQLFDFKNLPALRYGAPSPLHQIRSGTSTTEAAAAGRVLNWINRNRRAKEAGQFC